jgi:hypothetical protein
MTSRGTALSKQFNQNNHNVVTYLQMLVEGIRWKQIGEKVTHEAEKVGKEAGNILESKAAEKIASAVIKTVVRKG